ncbi:hypothetical protein JVT61DRAFT_6130 [Boletus reticuloceps]|uniref:GPI-anchored wall transfer protein 1 n=1 Tax=Boletus reticuloceps TaxID=495285 RepID=A0A8I2YLF8_9AGAM|nr:hypothetical protein JVT61DRAFT_6130 [Boletus reticuloceps]
MSLAPTVYADAPGALSALLLAPTCVLLLLPPIKSGTPLLLNINKPQPTAIPRESSTIDRSAQPALRSLPALTTYRSNMMLMTVFSILAVNFPVFPRSLANCKTYGVSLMDVGVGSFVFSHGIVSAIPLIKDPPQLHADVKPKLYRIIKRILPIVVLGIVRVLLVKGTTRRGAGSRKVSGTLSTQRVQQVESRKSPLTSNAAFFLHVPQLKCSWLNPRLPEIWINAYNAFREAIG